MWHATLLSKAVLVLPQNSRALNHSLSLTGKKTMTAPVTPLTIMHWHEKELLTAQQVAQATKWLIQWGIYRAEDVQYNPLYNNLMVNGPESLLFGTHMGNVDIYDMGTQLSNTRKIDGFEALYSMAYQEGRDAYDRFQHRIKPSQQQQQQQQEALVRTSRYPKRQSKKALKD